MQGDAGVTLIIRAGERVTYGDVMRRQEHKAFIMPTILTASISSSNDAQQRHIITLISMSYAHSSIMTWGPAPLALPIMSSMIFIDDANSADTYICKGYRAAAIRERSNQLVGQLSGRDCSEGAECERKIQAGWRVGMACSAATKSADTDICTGCRTATIRERGNQRVVQSPGRDSRKDGNGGFRRSASDAEAAR